MNQTAAEKEEGEWISAKQHDRCKACGHLECFHYVDGHEGATYCLVMHQDAAKHWRTCRCMDHGNL